jgi:hypothetical protein
MNNCKYCNKKIEDRRRKYCDQDCNSKFMLEGPAREQFQYHEVTPTLEILNEGAWMMYPRKQEDEQCIGDFIRVWHRPPEHVIWDPATPMWKFAGPVWTDEELTRRWQGWDEEREKAHNRTIARIAERQKQKKQESTDPRSKT